MSPPDLDAAGRAANEQALAMAAEGVPMPREAYSPQVVGKLVDALNAVMQSWKTGLNLKMPSRGPVEQLAPEVWQVLQGVNQVVEATGSQPIPIEVEDDRDLRLLTARIQQVAADPAIRAIARSPIAPSTDGSAGGTVKPGRGPEPEPSEDVLVKGMTRKK